MILPGHSADAIARATQALADGGLVAMPTETVYGLAANACDDRAVARIFEAKGRPSDHPLIVHIASAEQACEFASHVPDFAQRLMQSFWPGPLTLILPRRPEVAGGSAGGQDSIGLRCPSHTVAQALLLACASAGMNGLSAPSANRFGRVSPTEAAHVEEELGAKLLILDGGACQVGIESTIIDCTRGAPVLLRPGVLTRAQLEAACDCRVLAADDALDSAQPGPRASGGLESHYAPNAQVRLMDASALQAGVQLLSNELVSTQPTLAVYSRTPMKSRSSALLVRNMPADALASARELFGVLRDLDNQGVKLIWVETPPALPEWDGVRDRLMRASAHR